MKLETFCADGRLVIKFSGELDHHAAGETVRSMELAIDTHLPSECVLDFGGVTFMDSSGIAVIMKARRRTNEFDAELRVVNVPDKPRRVLSAAGLERLVNIQGLREVNT